MKIARVYVLLGLGAAVLASARPARAADDPKAGQNWGFKGLFPLGNAGGDYDRGLEKYISGNFELYKASPRGAWRYGAGFGFGSFALKPPFQEEEEFALMRTYLLGARVFRADKSVRPYVQLEAGVSRLHPRSALFGPQPPPELPPGESPTDPSNGFGFGLVPGVELSLGGTALSLDASLYALWSSTNYNLDDLGVPPVSSGTTFGGRLGLTWVPNGGAGGPGEKDPWGVHKSHGWAVGEVLGMDLLFSQLHEYVGAANFNQISPRSWWANFEEGFTYDDNDFRNNQLLHPVNGMMYYNGARYHGHNYWVSSAYAIGGSLMWECCGETHPMSYNDVMSTGLGGVALGEMTYRLSSKILDNSASGMGRFWKEAAAFLVQPVRGFNRVVSGHASRQQANPEDPMDWRPPGGGTFLAFGARTIGEGESISENTNTTGYFEFLHAYGSAFDNERNKPFDSFDVLLQFNFGDKVPLGQAQILGTLWKKRLGDQAKPNHVFEITQHFDYMNNENFEFGGQSFGPTLLSRFGLGGGWGLRTRLDASLMLLGAINSEYAKIADVADRERLREYDYGPGLGTSAIVTLTKSGRPLLAGLYRFQWINVSNGSIYNNDQLGISTSAEHYIQMAALRLLVPIKGNFGIGADGTVFFRKSRYDIEAFHDIDQRNPQARVYLTVNGIR